jgi:hypothetical protein
LIIATAIRYRLLVPTDNPEKGGVDRAIKGDVIAERIRRLTGEPGSADGLIEIPLVRHRHHYRVRIDSGGAAPRLVELHLVSVDDAAEIDPDTIRQVPVRRLAKAAARFINLTEYGVALAGDIDNPTDLERPDHLRGNRKYDAVHYREVARLLMAARRMGLPPREYVAERFAPVSLPTVDRWIAEAKKLGFLRRDWATTAVTDRHPSTTTTTEDDR